MTEPERISRRATGLSGELLRAGLEEQPSGLGMDRTLAALGVSSAVVASTAAAQAAASSMKVGSTAIGGGAAVAHATSTAMLIKWIGIGVVGGVGLAGVASVATSPAAPATVAAPRSSMSVSPRPLSLEAAAPSTLVAPPTPSEVAPPKPSAPSAAPRVPVPFEEEPMASSRPTADGSAVGTPLAAEVALVDRARAALGSGRTDEALALLAHYEREFPDARLLPEALFLKLEACERSGRMGEARAAAQQLLNGFPKSPHAARARKLLHP